MEFWNALFPTLKVYTTIPSGLPRSLVSSCLGGRFCQHAYVKMLGLNVFKQFHWLPSSHSTYNKSATRETTTSSPTFTVIHFKLFSKPPMPVFPGQQQASKNGDIVNKIGYTMDPHSKGPCSIITCLSSALLWSSHISRQNPTLL